MRPIIALVLSLAAAVTAAPQKQDGNSPLVARQQCTVDCTCLNANTNRSWEDTLRCCAPNGGTPDDVNNPNREYCRRIPFERAESGFGGCCGGGNRFECRTITCPE